MSFLSRITDYLRFCFIVHLLGTIFTEVKSLSLICFMYICPGFKEETLDQTVAMMNSLKHIYPEIANLSFTKQFSHFHDFSLKQGLPLGRLLLSARETCRFCNKKLSILSEHHVVVIYHMTQGTMLGSRFVKRCHKCKVNEHYGYYTVHSGKRRLFDSNWSMLDLFLSTEDTAVDMMMLRYYEKNLVHGTMAFSTFAQVYNNLFCDDGEDDVQEDMQPKVKRRKG